MPTRCLNIAGDGRIVSLQETSGMRGRYMTLTHRWNEETDRCKTILSNYEEKKKSIDIDELPKLFRDAVILAVKLGIEFIWYISKIPLP
jgi:hypothetical protein